MYPFESITSALFGTYSKNNPQSVYPYSSIIRCSLKTLFTKFPLTQLFVFLCFVTPTDDPYNSPSCHPGADHHPYHPWIGLIVRLGGDFLGKLHGGTHFNNRKIQRRARKLKLYQRAPAACTFGVTFELVLNEMFWYFAYRIALIPSLRLCLRAPHA